MNLCRYTLRNEVAGAPRFGLLSEDHVLSLPAGPGLLAHLLGQNNPGQSLERMKQQGNAEPIPLKSVRLLAPLDQQEIWAAGVTYERSKQARMEESEFSASAYDLVYAAPRPELFFKALPDKVSGPGDPVGIRADSTWTVPEPELALLISAHGRVVGYTIGNDMSARDIEGENLLYLPQAKIYRHSCALGPTIRFGASERDARSWTIALSIRRSGGEVFAGTTHLDRIRRPFDELAAFLVRSQDLPHGAVLLTGTGIVPPDDFSLQPGDDVAIRISGIGELRNPVVRV
jgi:2-dehydro-3-deoxy-D-arabinonate dehydratase